MEDLLTRQQQINYQVILILYTLDSIRFCAFGDSDSIANSSETAGSIGSILNGEVSFLGSGVVL